MTVVKVGLTVTEVPTPPPPRGGRNKVLYEEILPRDPTPYPLVCHFDRKDTPFVFLVH